MHARNSSAKFLYKDPTTENLYKLLMNSKDTLHSTFALKTKYFVHLINSKVTPLLLKIPSKVSYPTQNSINSPNKAQQDSGKTPQHRNFLRNLWFSSKNISEHGSAPKLTFICKGASWIRKLDHSTTDRRTM